MSFTNVPYSLLGKSFPLCASFSECVCFSISRTPVSEAFFVYFPAKFPITACRHVKHHLHLNSGMLHILLPAVWKHRCPCPITALKIAPHSLFREVTHFGESFARIMRKEGINRRTDAIGCPQRGLREEDSSKHLLWLKSGEPWLCLSCLHLPLK